MTVFSPSTGTPGEGREGAGATGITRNFNF
jgi:hypothetical protein